MSHPRPQTWQFNSNPTSLPPPPKKRNSTSKPNIETISFDFQTNPNPRSLLLSLTKQIPSIHHLYSQFTPLYSPSLLHREKNSLIPRWPTSKFHVESSSTRRQSWEPNGSVNPLVTYSTIGLQVAGNAGKDRKATTKERGEIAFASRREQREDHV